MTILEKASKELLDIKPDLAPGDLKKCAKAVGLAYENVSRYVNNKGKNPATAVKILTHLREVVDDRKKAIA